MTTICARVFEKDGNRFVIPAFCYSKNDELASTFDIIWGANSWAYWTKSTHEKEWLEFDLRDGITDIPFLTGSVEGSQFLHGDETVYFISGPLFDKAEK